MTDNLKQFQFFATAFVSAFTAFAFWQTLKLQTNIFRKKRTRKELSSLDLKDVHDINATTNQNIIITGVVATQNKSSFKIVLEQKGGLFQRNKSHTEELALFLKFKEPMYSNESFDQNKVNYRLNLKKICQGSTIQFNNTICIQGPTGKELPIKNLDRQDYSKVLEIIRWEEKKNPLSLGEELNVFFLSIIRAIATVFVKDREFELIRGIEIGTREVDAGIKIGASISILGTIGMNDKMELFIVPAQIFRDRMSFLKTLEDQINDLFRNRNIWFLGFFLGAIYVGRRAYLYCKKNNVEIPWKRR